MIFMVKYGILLSTAGRKDKLMSEITEKLIRQAAAGNQEAIAALYELTYSGIYKSVRTMVRDEDAVLDIVQDSYIKGFQSLDQLDKPENYRAWMKRIAANKAKDYLKKKKPVLFTEMENEDGEEADFRDERLEHCPEETLDRQETTRLINEILGTLSEDQRLVMGMFYYEEMSVREIAETLGCPENTVKSRLNYGRKKVEAKVRELEKKGTKLYSLAPLPFLLWLLRVDAQAAEIPSAAVLDSVTAACTASGSAAGAGTAGNAAAGTGTQAAVAGIQAAAGATAKALAAKIIAGILALAVIGGAAAATVFYYNSKADTPPPQQVSDAGSIPESSVSETSETASGQITAEEIYAPVIENYQSVLGADSEAYLAARENYFNGDHAILFYYHGYNGGHNFSFYYAYRDIDGNGTEELLIGAGSEDFIQIVDLYGFDGTQAVQLIDEPALGDRSKLTVLEDQTLSLFGGSSATQSSQEYWHLDGCRLLPAEPSSAAEIDDIGWNLLEVPQTSPESSSREEPDAVSFDTILADIQYVVDNIPKEEYQSKQAYYDSLYPHLGSGVLWELTFRDTDIYTLAVWKTFYDVDNDGKDELCIGKGVGLGRPISMFVIYKEDGTVIFGDRVFNYTLPEGSDEAGMPLAGWAYLGG